MKTSWSILPRIGFPIPLLLIAWTTSTHAQQPGSLDTGFRADTITGEVGFSVTAQPDGKVIAAGTFGVMRFLPDGSVDPAFKPIPPGLDPYAGPGTGVGAVALQPDGRILVTGSFTNAGGMLLPGLLRLHSDGSKDSSFSLDATVHPSGRLLALQPDGKVLTSGAVIGTDEGFFLGLLRLRSDGSRDPSFDASGVPTGELSALALGPDGKIYFVADGAIGRMHSDGSRDKSFNPELDLNPSAAIAVQRDGKVLVGQYTDGPGFPSVRRLLPSGKNDPAWTGPLANGGDAAVYAILVEPDGKVLVGGNNLESFNGVPNAHLGRLNADGSVDASFDTGPGLHHYSVEDLAMAPDGKVVVAGYNLDKASGYTPAPGVWRLNNDSGLQPRLAIRFTEADGVTLGISGQPGATYRLEYREALLGTGAWTPLIHITLSGDSVMLLDTDWTNSRMRYYRAVSVQWPAPTVNIR